MGIKAEAKHSTARKTRKNIRAKPKAKGAGYPTEKTRWAYWMRAIEPTSPAINAAWPGYHPLWVMDSQKKVVGAADFRVLRESLLQISREQCAAYLRVIPKTVERWETGRLKVPFPVFELLRLVYESVQFRLSHPAWDGWFIHERTGCFISPEVGKLDITPSELNSLPYLKQIARALEADKRALEKALQKAEAENTKLRQLISSNTVEQQLYAMKKKLDRLLSSVHTAQVVEIKPQSGRRTSPLKKTA